MKKILQEIILSVYPGSKYDDTCISKLSTKLGDKSSSKYTYIDVSDKENSIIGVKNNREEILLLDTNSIFQILDISSDNNWLILSVLPSVVSFGRVETQTVLFNTKFKKIVDFSKIMPEIIDVYDFEIINKDTYINVNKKTSLDIEKIPIKEVENKFLHFLQKN
jgi:hypothetical protein